MAKSINLKKLIWIDASAASLAFLSLITFRHCFAPLFGLPIALLTLMASIALCYATYGWQLILRKTYNYNWLFPLAIGNAAYGIMCLSALAWHSDMITPIGCVYLLFDASIVFLLTAVEWQAYQRDRTANNKQ